MVVINVDGFRSFKGSAEVLAGFVSTVGIFAWGNCMLCMKRDIYYSTVVTPENIQYLIAMYKGLDVFGMIKTVKLLLYVGKNVKLVGILLVVLQKSIKMTKNILAMVCIVLLLFATIGMSLFGGNITNNTTTEFKLYFGGDLDQGFMKYNFNDLLSSLCCLFAVMIGGYTGFDQLLYFQQRDRYNKLYYQYFWILFFMIGNICLINIFSGFIIDNIMVGICEYEANAKTEEEAIKASGRQEESLGGW